MAITTLWDVKEYLGISDELSDVKISRLIPQCEQIYLQIRAADWDEEGVYPIGSDITVAEMIAHKLATTPGEASIASESMTSYSVSYGGGGNTLFGFPLSVVGSIKKYVKGISSGALYQTLSQDHFDGVI
jgi:hypothetical protein